MRRGNSPLPLCGGWGRGVCFIKGGVDLNARHALGRTVELRMDLDYLRYHMLGKLDFDNQLLETGGYDSVFRSSIPTTIDIFSGKLDAKTTIAEGLTMLTGAKFSSSHTDNTATYQNLENQQW